MPVFKYEAVNQTGRITSGTFAGEFVGQAEEWLLRKGLSPISIEIDAGANKKDDVAPGIKKVSLKERLFGVSLDDRILFCRLTATMLSAGVPILQALRIMAKQINNQVLLNILFALADDIESGASLSESFAKYPKVFNALFLNVIRTGEESGSLDKSFNYLAELHENEKEVRERIKTATRYPKLVVSAMLGAIFFLMTFVVPKFLQMFAKANVSLPLPTKMLVVGSGFFTDYFFTIIVTVILALIAYHWCMRNPTMAFLRDHLVLKTPILGNLSIKIFMSRFCRVFEILTSSGVDIIKTLVLSGTALENLVLSQAIEKVTTEVGEGVSLHHALGTQDLFPDMVVQMIAIGEESGQIETMMSKVADYYEVETEYTIKNLSTMIEPILLLFMGILVGFIALAIFMPMWDMMNVARGGG
jgi:MSHA biogenesis protein MshG